MGSILARCMVVAASRSRQAPIGAGWSIGDAAFDGPDGRFRIVSGSIGENLIRADGATRAEPWGPACQQAEAVGRLGVSLSRLAGTTS
jgi:hypothetical protein